MFEERSRHWDAAQRRLFDVVIIGGGINGACLYDHLCSAGYRVLLAEKGDFGGGTSQASAMMIWGGLLYLRNFDLSAVWKLSQCRDRMIDEMKTSVRPQMFRYVVSPNGRNERLVQLALYCYWLFSRFKRCAPAFVDDFAEKAFLDPARFVHALDYEEACAFPSDSRFVLRWILSRKNDQQIPLNHCAVYKGEQHQPTGEWRLELKDTILRKEASIRARFVVNAAGVWADSLNRAFNIETKYKHIFSKGVFIGIRRPPGLTLPLILDSGDFGDCKSLIPWGPVALWGPTETTVNDCDQGFRVSPEDVDELLDELNSNLVFSVGPEDIISLRCGVRPLAVERSFDKKFHPLDLSRRSRIDHNIDKSWITLFGGKLTDCIPLAKSVVSRIQHEIQPASPVVSSIPNGEPDLAVFPGMPEKVPSAKWSMEHEMCMTLEDYLRRRTNISQWIARGGLGPNDENAHHLLQLCRLFCGNNEEQSAGMLRQYQKKINLEFDRPLRYSHRRGLRLPQKEEKHAS